VHQIDKGVRQISQGLQLFVGDAVQSGLRVGNCEHTERVPFRRAEYDSGVELESAVADGGMIDKTRILPDIHDYQVSLTLEDHV
jgi:hypothetical protein